MILALNTSTVQYSMALLEENGAVHAEYFITPEPKSFKGFMPALDDLLARSLQRIDHLESIIVATGPGSFTGLRVGLSAAKGFCQGLNIPIIGVSSLEAMANQLPYTRYPICPIIGSRKGEVFTALFKWSDEGIRVRLKEDSCISMKDLPTFIERKTILLGHDIKGQKPEIVKLCGGTALPAPAALWNLRASAVGALGLERFHQKDYDELQDLVPSYLRPPDIRPNPFPLLKDKPPAGSLVDGTLTNHDRK
jgi:tRNA threonylcarbamoyladenosine biosynthesis protein TsaB